MIKYNKNLLIPRVLMCVPSSLLLIFDRLNIEPDFLKDRDYDVKQFLLGSLLDLQISKDEASYFDNICVPYKLTENKSSKGCHIVDLNKQIFEKLNIPLKEHFYSIKHINDLDRMKIIIKNALDQDNDILLFLDYATLSFDKANAPIGHCMLISDLVEDNLIITSPQTEREIVIDTIKLDDHFLESIEIMNGGGISVIEKIESNERIVE